MLVSIDWISDFVKLPAMDPKDLCSRFTLGTAEVEDVIVDGEFFEKIRVARIEKVERHPDADKLNLVTFDFGDKEHKRVVCGAPNVRVGLKVPYAPLGTVLPGGFKLEPKKIRGVLSEGMLCSESELGFSEESSGLMEMDENAPVGKSLAEYLERKKDIVFDIDNKSLTHRPDLWGHYGMAREFAAVFEQELANPYDKKWEDNLLARISGAQAPVTPVVEDDGNACKGYFGLTVENVTVGESPDWMKRRLTTAGMRPINSMVDISNYVMLELGMPNHIFDRDTIKGDKLFIRKNGGESTFVTLDEVERTLLADDSVICDENGPLVIGGLMGGLSSGVTDKTKTVFLEVANWVPAMVRATSTRLGLRTDSSMRYEKSLDSHLMKRTLLRLLDLILEFNPEAKVVGSIAYSGDDLDHYEPLVLHTTVSRISKHLGKECSEELVTSILKRLDFKVENHNGDLSVTVPSYRATKDIEVEQDLFEEVGRIIGFDHIAPEAPAVNLFPAKLTSEQKVHRQCQDFLTMHGKFLEVMTYPMIGEKLLDKAKWTGGKDLQLINSLSSDHSMMRDSLLPGLMEMASNNQKFQKQFRTFELGRVYHRSDKDFRSEDDHLALMIYSKDGKDNVFMDLVNHVERLMNVLNVPFDFMEKSDKFKNELVPESWMGSHPYEFLNLRIMGRIHGGINSVHPLLLKSLKIKGKLAVAVVNLSAFNRRPMKEKVSYQPLPKFPGAEFDCTVVLERGAQVFDVFQCLKKIKLKEISNFEIADIFIQDNGARAVTIKTNFMDQEKTLTHEFLKAAEEKIISTLESGGYPLKS